MQDMHLYRVFVSSPADMKSERSTIKQTIENLSSTYERKGIKLSTFLWEDDACSEFGHPPQDIITNQLGDYDLYVGVMGARFGSSTAKYGSGTEQEFMEALDSYKRSSRPNVSFYFKIEQLPSNMSLDAHEQLAKVIKFRETIGPLGLFQEFSVDLELSLLVSKSISHALDSVLPDLSYIHHQYIIPIEESERVPNISKHFFHDHLNATGEDLSSGLSRIIMLDQIWVEPSLRVVAEGVEKSIAVETTESLDAIVSSIQSGQHFLITGDETSGKTSLCKTLFLRLFDRGHLPVLLDGDRISSPDLVKFQARVRTAYTDQYENIGVHRIDTDLKDKQVIIIDDFDLLHMNAVNAERFLSSLCDRYLAVIITAGSAFTFSKFDNPDIGSVQPVALRQIEILEFGKVKRYHLVDRWCSVAHAGLEEETLRTEIEEKRRVVDRILGANLVPRTPLVVLILLKALEMDQAGDLAEAGYVRYYKFLIDSAILKNLQRKEAEGAYSILPELAWATYNSPSRELSPQQIELVIEDFAHRRALPKTTLYSTLAGLKTINMFEVSGSSQRFKFDYTFYFFLADYISKNLQNVTMQEEVRKLCASVSSKEASDILVFLAFQTDAKIISETLISGVATLYPNADQFDFTKEKNSAITKLINDMPKLVVDHTKAMQSRDKHLEAEEEMETESRASDSDEESPPFETISTTLRAVEILGHIARNHYSKLDAEPKHKIIEAAVSVTLRCLGNMFDQLASSVDATVLAVRIMTDKFDKEADEKKKTEIANNVVFFLAVAIVSYFTRSLARAIGDENLEITYQTLLGSAPKNIQKYLDVVIKLDSFRQFPLREINELVAMVENNSLGMTCLRLSVRERLDMRPPSKAADRQRYCDAVGLKLAQTLVTKGKK